MKGLLNECLPQAQYSAISSTVTLSDDIFKNIKQGMKAIVTGKQIGRAHV